MIKRLDDQCGADNDETRQQDDEDRRAIAGIGEAIIKTANVAARLQREKALKEFTSAAARASAREARADRA